MVWIFLCDSSMHRAQALKQLFALEILEKNIFLSKSEKKSLFSILVGLESYSLWQLKNVFFIKCIKFFWVQNISNIYISNCIKAQIMKQKRKLIMEARRWPIHWVGLENRLKIAKNGPKAPPKWPKLVLNDF